MINSMQYVQESASIQTRGRGTTDISRLLAETVAATEVECGLCHVFIHHTSASLILCENADPDVRVDLETFMSALVPDGDANFIHTAEGPDDMPAHVRSILTQSELTLPVTHGQLVLGAWQGVYLWEHRTVGHSRRLTITVHGSERRVDAK